MNKRIYLDSNVFIALIKEEIDSQFNARYIESKNFFSYCAQEKHILILSELFFYEVQKITFMNKNSIEQELKEMGLELIFAKKPCKKLALKIIHETKIHFDDAMHVATAIENKADFIITFNFAKDFCISASEPPGKAVYPYVPLNRVSPVKITLSPNKQIPPAVWPGV